jgi:subtilisin family serine protease
MEGILYEADRNNTSLQPITQMPEKAEDRGHLEITWNAKPDTIYVLGIWTGAGTPVETLHVYSSDGVLDQMPVVAKGSIGIPATARGALAVGASGREYTSQGPTEDNRTKPDLFAEDGIPVSVFRTPFIGTSAAAPNAAGIAVLLASRHKTEKADQLRGRVLANVVHGSVVARPGGSRTLGGDLPVIAKGLTSRTVALPDYLGGEIAQGLLDGLLTGDAKRYEAFEAGVAVLRQGNPPRFQIGEPLEAAWKSSRDAYYVLLHRDPSGNYSTLAGGATGDVRLAAGRPQFLGGDDSEIEGTVIDPPGLSHLILICAESRVNLARVLSGEAPPDGVSISIAAFDAHR